MEMDIIQQLEQEIAQLRAKIPKEIWVLSKSIEKDIKSKEKSLKENLQELGVVESSNYKLIEVKSSPKIDLEAIQQDEEIMKIILEKGYQKPASITYKLLGKKGE
jgi:hypothetical protein